MLIHVMYKGDLTVTFPKRSHLTRFGKGCFKAGENQESGQSGDDVLWMLEIHPSLKAKSERNLHATTKLFPEDKRGQQRTGFENTALEAGIRHQESLACAL